MKNNNDLKKPVNFRMYQIQIDAVKKKYGSIQKFIDQVIEKEFGSVEKETKVVLKKKS